MASTLKGGTVFVSNLSEINLALQRSGLEIGKAMRKGLLEAAEPIRQDAGRLSQTKISGMKRAKKHPPPWSIQRKGQTAHEVYVVPTQRGVRNSNDPKSRPKFAEIMLVKAYEPALERNAERTRLYVDKWIGSVTRNF